MKTPGARIADIIRLLIQAEISDGNRIYRNGDMTYADLVESKLIEVLDQPISSALRDSDPVRLSPGEKLFADWFLAIQNANRAGCYGEAAQEVISELLGAIRAQGGPVCNDCRCNQARYTTGLCALCDLKLPPEQRGERSA